MNKQIVHYYDREAMAYTACYRLPKSPQALLVTSDKAKVTCQKCLARIEKENHER